MRQLMFGIAVAVGVTACNVQTTSSVIETAGAAQGVPVPDGWQPNERFTAMSVSSRIRPNDPVVRSRKGLTPEGNEYSYHRDGSGSVRPPGAGILGGWSIDCTRDKMTDHRDCKLYSRDAHLWIYFGNSSQPQRICIRDHDFPGRTGAIRIDKGYPIPTNTNGCISGSDSFSRLVSASSVTVRRVKWPYDRNVDATASLAGLKDAVELVRHIRARIDMLRFD